MFDRPINIGHKQLSKRYFKQVEINKYFQRKNVNIFLPIIIYMNFGCSKEPSH